MVEKKDYLPTPVEKCNVELDFFLSGSMNEQIRERMSLIIDSEAPITRSLLFKRLINSYGFLKVGSRIAEMLESIAATLQEETSMENGEVVYHKADDDNYFRVSGTNEDDFRFSYQIPLSESRNVVIYVLSLPENSRGMLKKELFSAFIRELGYTRRGSQLEKLFEATFKDMKEKGGISKKSNGKFMISEKTIS